MHAEALNDADFDDALLYFKDPLIAWQVAREIWHIHEKGCLPDHHMYIEFFEQLDDDYLYIHYDHLAPQD